jgi:hypothetical protein
MKVINYSLLCEDVAHLTFISSVMPSLIKLIDPAISMKLNLDFFKRFRCRNSKDVLNSYIDASIVAFSGSYTIRLLLIGIDYDDRNRKIFNDEIQKLYHKLPEKVKDNCVIFFPVQAIEHWLLFLKHRLENPKSMKNIAANIEGIPRKEAKKRFFGSDYPSKDEQITLIKKITKTKILTLTGCHQNHIVSGNSTMT